VCDVFSHMVNAMFCRSLSRSTKLSKDGFALLEIMLVVSILSVISISFARFFQYSRQYSQIICTKRNLHDVAQSLDTWMKTHHSVPSAGVFSSHKATESSVYSLGGAVGAVPFLQLSLSERSIIDGHGDEIIYICGMTEPVYMISESGGLYDDPAAYVLDTATSCNVYRDNGALYVRVGPLTHWRGQLNLCPQSAI